MGKRKKIKGLICLFIGILLIFIQLIKYDYILGFAPGISAECFGYNFCVLIIYCLAIYLIKRGIKIMKNSKQINTKL